MKIKIKLNIKDMLPRTMIQQRAKKVSNKKKYNRQKEKYSAKRHY